MILIGIYRFNVIKCYLIYYLIWLKYSIEIICVGIIWCCFFLVVGGGGVKKF